MSSGALFILFLDWLVYGQGRRRAASIIDTILNTELHTLKQIPYLEKKHSFCDSKPVAYIPRLVRRQESVGIATERANILINYGYCRFRLSNSQ